MSYNREIYGAVQSAIRDMNLSFYVEQAMREFQMAGYEQQRPSVLMRPKIAPDGNLWCAFYGDDLQSGVCGYGDTPAQAMYDFDKNWNTQKLYGEQK
jgi:hypothetical protein